jgi:aspartyl-tRNA(Asn)/glutamyl-tRNA(Gln) amidotransferase subunit B
MSTVERVEVVPVIGLEVHAQLETASKIFCPCPTTFGAPPNSATCPVCLGFPGTLPVLNREAVALALRVALAAGCRIDRASSFARKNYFYPDLPKGYQITQYERPLASGGAISIDTPAGERAIDLVRIHLEEDAGKLLHENPFADVPDTVSLVDWNRSGVPLIEIVGEPELRSPEEAFAYLMELRKLLRYVGASEANMEEGNLRCDANVSVRRSEHAPMGTRVEIKNLNSMRHVARALEYEIERQAEALSRGDRVVQETRLWDAAAGRTLPMRSKEEAHDYRYFPEPDLATLEISEDWIEEVRRSLPELPRPRRARFIEQYGLAPADAELLTSARPLADYFERVVAARVPARLAANWVGGEVIRWMKEQRLSPEAADQFDVAPAALADLLRLVEQGEVSGSAAKIVLEEMVGTGKPAGQIVREKGLVRLSDDSAIRQTAEGVIAANPKQRELYRSGKTATFGWFVGQVMKATGGRADPTVVHRVLKDLLEEKA